MSMILNHWVNWILNIISKSCNIFAPFGWVVVWQREFLWASDVYWVYFRLFSLFIRLVFVFGIWSKYTNCKSAQLCPAAKIRKKRSHAPPTRQISYGTRLFSGQIVCVSATSTKFFSVFFSCKFLGRNGETGVKLMLRATLLLAFDGVAACKLKLLTIETV